MESTTSKRAAVIHNDSVLAIQKRRSICVHQRPFQSPIDAIVGMGKRQLHIWESPRALMPHLVRIRRPRGFSELGGVKNDIRKVVFIKRRRGGNGIIWIVDGVGRVFCNDGQTGKDGGSLRTRITFRPAVASFAPMASLAPPFSLVTTATTIAHAYFSAGLF